MGTTVLNADVVDSNQGAASGVRGQPGGSSPARGNASHFDSRCIMRRWSLARACTTTCLRDASSAPLGVSTRLTFPRRKSGSTMSTLTCRVVTSSCFFFVVRAFVSAASSLATMAWS